MDDSMKAKQELYDSLDSMTVPLAPLLKILECCVCLDVVKMSFKLCNSGHLICSECFRELTNCPTCKADVFLENPVSMKNLLEALPKPCRHFESGCKEIVEPSSDHATYCGFRPVKCRAFECAKKKIIASQIKEHVEKNHPGRLHTASRGCFGYFNGAPGLSSNTGTIFPKYVENVFFWLNIKRFFGIYRINFQGVFAGKPETDYLIDLIFENGDIKCSFTLKALQDDENRWADVDNCATMKLFSSSLEKFIGSDQVIFSYYIRSKKSDCSKP